MILSFTELQKKRHRFQNEPRVVQQLLSIWRSLLVSLAVRLELPLTGKHLVDLLLNDFYQSWKRIKIEICISIGAKIPHNQRNGMKFHQCWKIKLKWKERKKLAREIERMQKSRNAYPPGILSLVTLLHSLSFSLLNFPLPVRVAVIAVVVAAFDDPVVFDVVWLSPNVDAWRWWCDEFCAWLLCVPVKSSVFKSGSVYQASRLEIGVGGGQIGQILFFIN